MKCALHFVKWVLNKNYFNISAPSVPSCYKTVAFHGFVEELVVNDDPEYQVRFYETS